MFNASVATINFCIKSILGNFWCTDVKRNTKATDAIS